MRRFALLTALFTVILAGLAFGLPSADAYVEGVDDGPPQRFSDVAEAGRAAGYDIPHIRNLPGWRIEAIMVTPVYHGRKLLEELTKRPMVRRLPGGRNLIFVAVPGTAPSGVHNYVDLTYVSDNGVYVTLAINRRPTGPVVASLEGEGTKTEERVRIGGKSTSLVTLKTSSMEAMAADWVLDGVPIRATAFSFVTKARPALTKDELLRMIEAVR